MIVVCPNGGTNFVTVLVRVPNVVIELGDE